MNKNDEKIIESIFNAAQKTIPKRCTQYSQSFLIDFMENEIGPDEKFEFEKHRTTCRHCRERTMELQAIRDSYDKDMRNELAAARSLAEMNRQVDAVFGEQSRRRHAHRLAADGRPKTHPDLIGKALGVAVDQETRSGSIIECFARVSREISPEPQFIIRGYETGAYVWDGITAVLKRPPLEILGDELTDVFTRNPLFERYELWKRRIVVRLIIPDTDVGVIKESESLALTVLVAIMQAFTQTPLKETIAFSSGIKPGGDLSAVGSLEDKITILKRHGIAELVLCQQNMPELKQVDMDRAGFSIRPAENIADVLQYLGFLDQKDQVPDTPDAQVVSATVAAIDSVAAKGLEPGYEHITRIMTTGDRTERQAAGLLELAADFLQMGSKTQALKTTFLLGDPDEITRILPVSQLAPMKVASVFALKEKIVELSGFVDGDYLGFVVDKDNKVPAIVKLDFTAEGIPGISKTLTGKYRQLAAISMLTRAGILSITAANDRIILFDRGTLAGLYRNGIWVKIDLESLDRLLPDLAKKKKISPNVMTRVAQAIFELLDLSRECTFVLSPDINLLRPYYIDSLASRLGLKYSGQPVDALSRKQLIKLAGQDGAILMDYKGIVHAFMARLNVQGSYKVHGDSLLSLNQIQAVSISRQLDCLCIMTTPYGRLYIYENGEKVYEL